MEDEYFILAIGTSWVCFIVIINGHSFEYVLPNIYYVSNLTNNLLSISILSQYRYRLEFIKIRCQLTKLDQVIVIAYKKNNLNIINVLLFISEYIYAITIDDANILIDFICYNLILKVLRNKKNLVLGLI